MTGFGAGVWKNMKISNPNISIKRPETLDTEVNKYNIDDETSNQDIDISSISGVGQSATGYEFVPVDDGSSFGIKGEMYIAADRAAGGSRVLNGKVSITATTANGKFESILLAGEVHAIGDGKQKHVVDATAEIGYNHPSRQFHINVNVEADFLGFMSATIPFELKVDGLKKEWFVGIGKPLYGSGETFSIAYGFDLSVVKMKSSLEGYICGGNMVPYDMPELPKAILDVLKMKPTKSSFPKGSATAGFMLGARYSFEFDFNFGPLYAGLYSLIGFDLEMRNRSGAVCGNGDKIGGINGYYCQGQIYGYISGDIGVQLKFFGKTKKFSLCSITAGAMLKAGLPNPTWMKGAVGVKGEILGGLVKFHTTAKFSIGNECKTLSDPLKDLIVVESISPGSASLSEANSVSKKPSIFTSPKIACNVRMNQDFDLYSDDGEQQVKRIYKFEFKDITYAEANNLSSKVTIKNFIDLSQKNNEFVLRSADMLKPFTNYMVKVRVQIREWRQGSYKLPWGENKEYTDAEATQEKVVYFKTGEKPDVIHPDNIRESYPMENQFETFVKNGQKGYIVLEHSQKYLFDNRDKSLGKEALYGEYIKRAIPNSKPVKFLYDYISANPYNYIQFDMKDLAASSIYECKFYVVNSKQKEAEFIVKTKEEEIINREYVDKPIDLPKLPGGTFQSKGSTGGVGGSNRFNSLTTNKNLTNNSPGITYSGNLIKKFQFDEVSSLTKVSEKGKYYSSNQDASDSDKSKLSKAEQEQKAAQINANIKGIFKYHFRTSQYNSVENKMKTIQLYYGDLMDRYSQVKWTNQKNTTEKEGQGIGNLSNPYLTSYFPYWTTKEEVFGGKSFEDGSNAEYQPAMFQYYANGKNTYMHPFTRYGLSPRYENYTLHLGYRNMSLSPAIFSGKTFYGGEAEMNFQNFRFSAFYGEIEEAQNFDTVNKSRYPRFARTAMGGKMGFSAGGFSLDLTLLKAQDDSNSISIFNPAKSINPEDNLVMGLNSSFSFLSYFNISTEWAVSGYTKNTAGNLIDHEYARRFRKVFNAMENSTIGYLTNNVLGFQMSSFGLQFNYRLISPEYTSLGVPNMGNNMQSMGANTNFQLFENVLSISAFYNNQQDNISQNQIMTTNTNSFGMDFNSQISDQFTLDGSYNGLFTNQKPVQELTPELEEEYPLYSLTNNSFNLIPSYSLENGDLNHSFSLPLDLFLSNSGSSADENNTITNTYTISPSYSLSFSKLDLNTGVSYSFTSSTTDSITDSRHVFSAFANKAFLEKKELSLSTSLSYGMDNRTIESISYINLSGSVSYRLFEQHNFALTFSYATGSSSAYYNFRTALSYNWGIPPLSSWGKKKEDKAKQ